jgi:hypothetical protein
MAPLVPAGSRLTVRFGRLGLTAGDVVLYAAGERLVAHRILKLGRRGRRWGHLRVKGDPVRASEAAWIPLEDVVGRVCAVRTPDGRALLLNSGAGRAANRAAALISGLVGAAEGRLRRILGARRALRAAPALLALLRPAYLAGARPRRPEAGLLLGPEERFLLAASRVRMAAEDERRLRRLVEADVPWGRIPGAASALGLAPLVYRNLTRAAVRPGVPREALSALSRSAHAAACQMAIQLDALDEILDALRGAGVAPILLKGAALALALYDQPALRAMQDLDLLVEPGRVEASIDVLRRVGYRAIQGARSDAFYSGHHHAIPMVGRGGRVVVEIHRGLVPPEEGLHLDPAPFFARAAEVEVRAKRYRMLAPEDQVLHACLHLSYCDRFAGRLRDLTDVHALLEGLGESVDWGILLGSALRTDVCRSLYASLDLARRLLGTNVPQEVMWELARGAGWDPVSERLLRAFARAGLFLGTPSEGILPRDSTRWICGTLIKRSRWSGRLRDLVNLLQGA